MDLVIHLEYKPSVPLFRRLSDALRRAIVEGRLRPGQAMPSVRDLSDSLSIARSTVFKSFDDLRRQGYLEAVKGKGTFVRTELPGELSAVYADQARPTTSSAASSDSDIYHCQCSQYGMRALKCNAARLARNDQLEKINFEGPALEVTPLSQWRRLLLRHCRLRDLAQLAYSVAPFGYPPLQEALAAYLHRARSVTFTPSRVVVFASNQLRLDIPLRLLVDPGDAVAFEEPGYQEARQALSARGARIVPIPVDESGMQVHYLASLPERFKLVYVTPSHQDPTGALMSIERRRQLLAWAHETGSFIIEDDYDSEYRYGTEPLPSLQGLDYSDRVIYLSTFWKILSPIVRMGFLVIPECLMDAVLLAKTNTERDLPLLEQFALTDFINEGHLEKHIKRSQSLYARRRQSLIHALTVHLRGIVTIAPQSSGMHVLVHAERDVSEDTLVIAASKAGLPLMSTEQCYMGEGRRGELIIPFAHLSEERIKSAVRLWREHLDRQVRDG